ncbi:hypothetical protein BJ138DRAFT_1105235 [Hygrophoropsis aurantiaca]|uniref:Uncharacterized protein n=1 Tax=Hygrophoropsis aurantiaca TaxID=72124 RepID=A0ACB7ZZ51_9AGAM|nr:hypothetical protein BJ138DRAFT_1105235 [Hygrophoropsis aurantiaca]
MRCYKLLTEDKVLDVDRRLQSTAYKPGSQRVKGVLLGTACARPLAVDVTVDEHNDPDVDFWLRLNGNCCFNRSFQLKQFPGCRHFTLESSYHIFYLEQSPDLAANSALDWCTRYNALSVKGEVLILKHLNHEEGWIDITPRDYHLVNGLVGAATTALYFHRFEMMQTATYRTGNRQIQGLLLGTACERAIGVKVLVDNGNEPNASFWLKLNRNKVDIVRLDVSNFPGSEHFELASTFVVYHLEQPANALQHNECLELCTDTLSSTVRGDILVLKLSADGTEWKDINVRDYHLVRGILGACLVKGKDGLISGLMAMIS